MLIKKERKHRKRGGQGWVNLYNAMVVSGAMSAVEAEILCDSVYGKRVQPKEYPATRQRNTGTKRMQRKKK